jgi:hypothetical protein
LDDVGSSLSQSLCPLVAGVVLCDFDCDGPGLDATNGGAFFLSAFLVTERVSS